MKVLVTGAEGFIGSHLTEALVRCGHEVRAFVLYNSFDSRGWLDHCAADVRGKFEVFAGDIRDPHGVRLGLKGCDAVLHLAALIEAGESMKAPEVFFRNNTANALTLLEAMLAAGVKRFVFSSTAALYGNPERTPIQEDDALAPTNAYGESKLLVERMLAWFHRIHGLRYASLRYFNAAGASRPDQGEAHQPESHLIPRILAVALGRAQHANIFGTDYATPDGTCVRDYIHVSDLARAHLLAVDALAKERENSVPLIYNLGNGQGFSVRQVVDVARQVTGHPIPVIESPRRPGDPAVLIASSEKIRRELGWQPRFPDLQTIVESAWQWHRAHPNGYSGEDAAQRK